MYRIYFITILLCFAAGSAKTQNRVADTVRQEAVIVKGFETSRPLLTTAAAVSVATQKDIQRYPNTSLVPVMNQLPGVRMEERSPGSYRLSVRGSLLRSPFGVRNIKVYLAGIPFTDAGGNTYLNLLDVNMIQRLEIIKGPAGITYGAGTGGTLLLNDETGPKQPAVSATLNGGSYNSWGEHIRVQVQQQKTTLSVQQSHFQSRGYREHSALRRNAVMLNGTVNKGPKNQWQFFVLYGKLNYETPGGITKEQMQLNPRFSRQRSGSLPSAIEQNAGIHQQTFFSGLSNQRVFNKRWSNSTSLFAAYTDLANPFITNYETRFEKSAGGRSVFRYQSANEGIKINTGMEAAITASQITNYGNRGGAKDTIQNKDETMAKQAFVFVQAQIKLFARFLLDAGISSNLFRWQYRRLLATPGSGSRTLAPQWLPRLAILYRPHANMSVYCSIGRGYSPPTLAELRPDNQVLNTNLQPEAGTSFETGWRGSFLNGRVFADFSAYYFRLNNTIVRRNSINGDYFVNAGHTRQKGIEAYIHTFLMQQDRKEQIKIFSSVTLNHYRFGEYTVGNAVYNGNKITGIPGKIITLGADVQVFNGAYLDITGSYTAAIPLTDNNAVTAEPFYLLGCRTGYRFQYKNCRFDGFVAGNNLLNETYSQGHDLNAAGNRYYNPAAKSHFTIGITMNRQ